MIGLVLKYWRIIAIGAAMASALGFLAYWSHLRKEAAQARSVAVSAQQGEQMAEATTRTVVRYHETERVIRETAEPIIRTIEEAPDAQTSIPDDVLGSWRAGINSLRQPAAPAAHDNGSDTTQ